ncbi:MAG: HypC/HybG/HupF family hydrogenase formation chaperone [Planctomycetes bacterium]|nr:HypC/HybG/HupF family hydrogenase formation chaperone [Planctomycetota bacterium]
MCLAVPGKIVEMKDHEGSFPTGTVDFQGSRIEVSLALVPGAGRGDWVLVHAGFAISRLEEAEAMETWDYLKQSGLVPENGMVE